MTEEKGCTVHGIFKDALPLFMDVCCSFYVSAKLSGIYIEISEFLFSCI